MWSDAADFVSGLVPFIEEGLDADEPVMVAVIGEHATWLRNALGARASRVSFVDMRELGHNPARIIPGWQQFLDAHASAGKPLRGIGEPIWAGRRAEEVHECQLHEALLNVAVDPDLPFWLVCPYDTARLDKSILEEAQRSHPAIHHGLTYRGSTAYGGRAHVDSLFGARLPPLRGEPQTLRFAPEDLHSVFSFVTLHAYRSGLWSDRATSLAVATRQLVASSLHRGASEGCIQIWDTPEALICEVTDATMVSDRLAGRRLRRQDEHDALWWANQYCDLVQLRSGESGTVVRLHAWKDTGH